MGAGTNDFKIPDAIRKLNPLITRESFATLRKLKEDPHAPHWNHEAGDRLQKEDLVVLDSYRKELVVRCGQASRSDGPSPPAAIRNWAEKLVYRVPSFQKRVSEEVDLEEQWTDIGTMSREDIATHPEELLPLDADLEEMIVYRTAGTTGHALLVPHHHRAAAMYQVLIEFALEQYDLRLDFAPDQVACFLIGAQANTVTYPTVLSAWNGAGFAKLNLSAHEWPEEESPHRYFESFPPRFLTGDPISYAEMLRLDIPARPMALISTAVAMSLGLKKRLEKRYGCPVIDWYSLTETGPIGYACPETDGYHILPHDVYVESLDAEGRSVPSETRGEIAVTGGRNPYLPLLRYRTGDWGRLDHNPCACGDPMPRILDLEGRAPVVFRAANGSIVNPVDISRLLRGFPLIQHQFHQGSDRRCRLVARPLHDAHPTLARNIEKALRGLFGGDIPIQVEFDTDLGRRPTEKILPYRSELLLED